MVGRILIYLLSAILLSSCAQVGTISGGPQDEKAPEIKKMTPENKGTNVTTNEIIIEFDDFIKLNNPAQTIQVVPPDFKVNATAKGKIVTLNWSEPMQSNTTYSIFLNKTIQDITESNDSIMQLVFSTGDQIDSLTYTCFVKDAFLQTPAKKVIVGLFVSADSIRPTYYSQTNEQGEATFNYLKQGTYFVRAFNDKDNNLQITKNEPIGFKAIPIELSSSVVDSIPIPLFQPKLNPKITTFQFQAPGAFSIGANRSLNNVTFEMNKTLISESTIYRITQDSIFIYFNPNDAKTIELVAKGSEINDTVNLRMPLSKAKVLKIQGPTNNKVLYNEALEFTCLDQIAKVDTSLIKLLNQKDSSRLTNYSFQTIGNSLKINLDKSNLDNLIIQFENGALVGSSQATHPKTNFSIGVTKQKEVGSIVLDHSKFNHSIILEVYLADKKVRTLSIVDSKISRLDNLLPGDYTFKAIDDVNSNGIWDTGDFYTKLMPEKIFIFNEPTKVRANWEINVSLAPNKTNDGE